MNVTCWNEVLGSSFVLPILKAILAHLYIAWIHPFGDGNGRTARLMEFDILTRAGVPTVCAHLLSDYYNRTRSAYYRALSQARRDPVQFVRYAVRGFADGLREQLKTIREQQMSVVWINYVYQRFSRAAHSAATDRRREIAIRLSFEVEPVPFTQIPSLSTKLSAHFAHRTPRALERDLLELMGMELIRMDKEGRVWANMDKVLAFLPLANRPPLPTSPQLELS
jgi:hypothetical protein